MVIVSLCGWGTLLFYTIVKYTLFCIENHFYLTIMLTNMRKSYLILRHSTCITCLKKYFSFQQMYIDLHAYGMTFDKHNDNIMIIFTLRRIPTTCTFHPCSLTFPQRTCLTFRANVPNIYTSLSCLWTRSECLECIYAFYIILIKLFFKCTCTHEPFVYAFFPHV